MAKLNQLFLLTTTTFVICSKCFGSGSEVRLANEMIIEQSIKDGHSQTGRRTRRRRRRQSAKLVALDD